MSVTTRIASNGARETRNTGETPDPTRLTARSLEEAEHIVRQVYVQHRLLSAREDGLGFRLESGCSPRLTIGRLCYGADVELAVPAMQSAYHVNIPISGEVAAHQAAVQVSASRCRTGVIFDPHQSHRARWGRDAMAYALKIDAEALQRHARDLLGGQPPPVLRFPLGFSLSGVGGRSLASAVRYLWHEVCRGGSVALNPLLRTQLEGFVLTQLLTVVPSAVHDLLSRPVRRPRRRHVARVVDYIHAHPEEPLTLADLARIGEVGARALQEGFREEFGIAPTGYLRSVRLSRVHRDLLQAEPGTKVTTVASRWGFTHLSRFSEQYKQRFGVSPSVTLRSATAAQRP